MSKIDRRRRAARSRRRQPTTPALRVRMHPDDRIDMILGGAVKFFAERGFKAQTRELARRVGVSQSLIYHYFNTKNDLIEQVYRHNFLSRWNGEWGTILADRDVPLECRLKTFYGQYLRVMDDNDWIRIAMYSGLQDADLARRGIVSRIEQLMRLIAVEVAHETRPGDGDAEPSEADLELAWHLHSTFVHYLVRKHIFRISAIGDVAALIGGTVDQFLAGARACAAAGAGSIAAADSPAAVRPGRLSSGFTQPHSRSA
jgi:AcrR family transcriptional regulator